MGCGKRTIEPNCHDACEEYGEWLAERRKRQAAENTGKEADAFRWDARERYFKRMNGRERVGQV